MIYPAQYSLATRHRLGQLALMVAGILLIAAPQGVVAAPAQKGCDGSPGQWSSPPDMLLDPGGHYSATISTSLGDIEVDLLANDAPLTVNNFVFLAQQCFYDHVPFHRIINGFMIQTGDPTGTGRGGPGYRFPDETVVGDYTRGTLAMANAGPNTNGSQFFIVQGDGVSLPKSYTIFGKVTSGMDVVDALASVPVAVTPSGERSAPIQEVDILTVTIHED